MKKSNYVFIALLIGAMSICVTSCSKEQGCTDPDSKNYNINAEEDDGSCLYEGSIVFWFNQSTANDLMEDDAISLKYYVDGNLIGSSATSVYWTGAPNCDQSGAVSVTKDLGDTKTKSFTYSVKDQTGFEYWSGNIIFTANTCTAYELK
jgi:hypothetical protein